MVASRKVIVIDRKVIVNDQGNSRRMVASVMRNFGGGKFGNYEGKENAEEIRGGLIYGQFATTKRQISSFKVQKVCSRTTSVAIQSLTLKTLRPKSISVMTFVARLATATCGHISIATHATELVRLQNSVAIFGISCSDAFKEKGNR